MADMRAASSDRSDLCSILTWNVMRPMGLSRSAAQILVSFGYESFNSSVISCEVIVIVYYCETASEQRARAAL
jgi:hypothetical protein